MLLLSSENYRNVDLLGYLPTYLQNYNEFKILAEVEEPELESLFNELRVVRNNQFINSCDELGVERFEKLLGIGVNKNDALETRRARVLVKWLQDIPYTFETLEKQLDNLCGSFGYSMTLLQEIYQLDVAVSLAYRGLYNEVQEVLNRIVPCNLVINLYVDYNKHGTLKPITHSELGNLTNKELRERVFEVS